MKKQLFKREVIEQVQELHPEITVNLDKISKINRNIETLTVIKPNEGNKGLSSCPNISLDDLYQLSEGNVSSAVEFIVEISQVDIPEDVGSWAKQLCSRDLIQARVFPAMINRERNLDFLSNHVFRNFLDLAIVYGVSFNDYFVWLTQSMMSEAQLTEEEIYEYAVQNLQPDIFCQPGSKLYMISNECTGAFGSGAILEKETLMEMLDHLGGGEIYLIPSSIHEWLVAPTESIELDEMKELVITANRTILSQKDWLSDNVYVFDGRQVKIAG